MKTENFTSEDTENGAKILFEETSYPFRIFLGTMVLLVLYVSLHFRFQIFKYLSAPTTSKKNINFIFWFEQLSQLTYAATLAIYIAILISPVPLDELFGNEFCQWAHVPGGIFIPGISVWSHATAAYRFKLMKWPKSMESHRLAVIIVIFGVAYHFLMAFMLFKSSKTRLITRMCYHGITKGLEVKKVMKSYFLMKKLFKHHICC